MHFKAELIYTFKLTPEAYIIENRLLLLRCRLIFMTVLELSSNSAYISRKFSFSIIFSCQNLHCLLCDITLIYHLQKMQQFNL